MARIIPAILSDTLDDVNQKLDRLRGLVSDIHIDIMDGRFVNSVSFDLSECKLLNWSGASEVHLMVENPDRYFDRCEWLGFERVIFHVEAINDFFEFNDLLKKYSFQKGLAINPGTSFELVKPFIGEIDFFLIMGVMPGFSGRSFLPETLRSIVILKRESSHLPIWVDGGLNRSNIKEVLLAGADTCIVNSDLFSADDLRARLNEFNSLL